MRSFVVVLPLLLIATACDSSAPTPVEESTAKSAPAVVEPAKPAPLPWLAALGDSPAILRTYSTAVGPLPGSAVNSTDTYSVITTTNVNGGWAGMLILGEEASVAGSVLKINLQVDSGALHLLSTIDAAPAGYAPFDEVVKAGPATDVYLPVDTAGAPLLVIANANVEGPSEAKIFGIDLRAPANTASAPVSPTPLQPN